MDREKTHFNTVSLTYLNTTKHLQKFVAKLI